MRYENYIAHSVPNKYAFSHNRTQGWTFDSHVHMCYEIIYVIEGHFSYTIEGYEYMLSSGDMVITSPYELHSFIFPENSVYERQFLHIYPEFINDFSYVFSEISNYKFGTYNYIPAALVNKYGLHSYMQNIEDYCKNRHENVNIMTLTYSLQLIVKISEMLKTENITQSKVQENKTVEQIKAYVDKNFKLPLTLDEIAQSVYLNKSYVCRLFKQKTGITLKTYMNMKRIIYAKNKIFNGESPSTIYSSCGFNDYTTFYRSFMKYVSMPPNEFKASLMK